MKKKKNRMIAFLLTTALTLGLLAGCGTEETKEPASSQSQQTQGQTSVVPQAKNAYKAQYLNMTTNDGSELDYVEDFCVSGTSAYYAGSFLSGQVPAEDENGEPVTDENGEIIYNEEYSAGVFRMDLTTGEITRFESYTPAAIPDGMEGSNSIEGVFAGADGTIWILELTYTYSFDLPAEFDASTDEQWDYYVEGDRITTLSQYDAQGQKLNAVSIPLDPDTYVYNAIVGNDGTIYLCDWQGVYVFDANGEKLFDLTPENGMNDVLQMGDEIGITTWNDEGHVFLPIDLETKAFGKEYRLSDNAYNLASGTDEYSYLFRDSNGVYGYNEDTQTEEKLLSWLDCDVDGNNIEDFYIQADGRVVAMERDWNSTGMETGLIILEPVEASSLPQKQILTLACFGLNSQLRTLIVNFNRTHDDIRIQAEDYSELVNDDTTYNDALQKLNTQIISGSAPDLLCLSSMSTEQYMAKGILLDLWPMIDSDETLSRDDLMTHLFDCMSTDGKLYQITNSFAIQTAAVRKDIAGDRTSWSLDEVKEALSQLEDGATILSNTVTKSEMLSTCLEFNLNQYLDWSTGQCGFDSPEFVELLNFVNAFPESFDWENYDYETEESEYSRLQTHKQLMTSVYLADFDELQVQPALHGGEITYIGYPASEGNGSCFYLSTTLSISATCSDPEAAWSFARELLLAENQADVWYFPSNKEAFDAKVEQAMTKRYTTDPETGEQVEVSQGGIGYGNDFMVDLYATTQEQYDAFMDLYERTQSVYSYNTELTEIVQEECAAFFAGQKTAEETANLIQNRVSLYVAERQ